MGVKDFTNAAKHLQPDIVLALGDVPFTAKTSLKRADRMADRSVLWLRDIVSSRSDIIKSGGETPYEIFAPVLPLSREMQSWYLNKVVDEMASEIAGLAVFNSQSVLEIPQELCELPRLSLDDPHSPHRILHDISLGIDLFVLPLLATATDSGIAMDFDFPPKPDHAQEKDASSRATLGVDMWSSDHATDLSPLKSDCTCYTCNNHSRAFIQHLLNAKEMLAWVLLQIHNHHVMDRFFCNIRSSIEDGNFDEHRLKFERYYEPEMPRQTGQGPRVRGYQYKSEGGDQKRNQASFRMLNSGEEENAEAPIPPPNARASNLEHVGFADKAEHLAA
jgi:queuine tRNA-ribosyltransferase accessory subunit